METTEPALEARNVGPAFARRLAWSVLILALVSLGISFGGRELGRSISAGGHTPSIELRDVRLAGQRLVVPENAIRFEAARRDGPALRLDLYLHWPDMEGYSEAKKAAFNDQETDRSILFLAFEEQAMSRDMNGRFDPIYSSLIEEVPVGGIGDVEIYRFRDNTGYLDETLAVARDGGSVAFVARCMAERASAASMAPCERDIVVADNLSVIYRFPRRLLVDWKLLDAAVRDTAAHYLAR